MKAGNAIEEFANAASWVLHRRAARRRACRGARPARCGAGAAELRDEPPASDSPLQQQILRNYRSDLQQTQRELAMRNPSGLSREQLEVTHQLNAVNSALHTPPPATRYRLLARRYSVPFR